MKCLMEIETFVKNLVLPPGYRWHEMTPDKFFAPTPTPLKKDNQFDSVICALEKNEEDGNRKYVSFEIASLTDEWNSHIKTISVVEFSQAVDKAIAEMEG